MHLLTFSVLFTLVYQEVCVSFFYDGCRENRQSDRQTDNDGEKKLLELAFVPCNVEVWAVESILEAGVKPRKGKT